MTVFVLIEDYVSDFNQTIKITLFETLDKAREEFNRLVAIDINENPGEVITNEDCYYESWDAEGEYAENHTVIYINEMPVK